MQPENKWPVMFYNLTMTLQTKTLDYSCTSKHKKRQSDIDIANTLLLAC